MTLERLTLERLTTYGTLQRGRVCEASQRCHSFFKGREETHDVYLSRLLPFLSLSLSFNFAFSTSTFLPFAITIYIQYSYFMYLLSPLFLYPIMTYSVYEILRVLITKNKLGSDLSTPSFQFLCNDAQSIQQKRTNCIFERSLILTKALLLKKDILF